jgi:hypothetical protein
MNRKYHYTSTPKSQIGVEHEYYDFMISAKNIDHARKLGRAEINRLLERDGDNPANIDSYRDKVKWVRYGSWIVDADTKREAFEEIKKEMDRSLEERKCRKHMK